MEDVSRVEKHILTKTSIQIYRPLLLLCTKKHREKNVEKPLEIQEEMIEKSVAKPIVVEPAEKPDLKPTVEEPVEESTKIIPDVEAARPEAKQPSADVNSLEPDFGPEMNDEPGDVYRKEYETIRICRNI